MQINGPAHREGSRGALGVRVLWLRSAGWDASLDRLHEETKEGFRGEAAAALEAVWPLLLRKELGRHLLKRA